MAAASVATLPAPVSAATGGEFASQRVSTPALTDASWLFGREDAAHYVLPTFHEIRLLDSYRRPGVERPYPSRSFRDGAYGVSSWTWGPRLSWSSTGCEAPDEPVPRFVQPDHTPDLRLSPAAHVLPSELSGVQLLPTWATQAAPAPREDLLFVSAPKPCAAWQRVQPVTIARYGAELDRIQLTECDGSVAPDAIDRLSVAARPTHVPRPELPLPLEPEPESAARGEWLPGVKILHPRLVWALQRIAEAFPRRPVYIISGYRSESTASYHHKGRALDLFVMGVPNEDLFQFCRTLRDVACGYYPHNTFVHVDVRLPGTGHAMWIDDSRPGEPSHYVDAWPGVVEGGALDWAGQH